MTKEKKEIKQFKEDLTVQINESKNKVEQLIGDISRDAFNSRPRPGKWSIAQNINHINISVDLYRQRMIESLETAKTNNIVGKTVTLYSPRFLMAKFISLMEPPVKFLFKAPQVFQPAEDMDKEVVLQHFIYVRDLFLQDLNEVIHQNQLLMKITSPVTNLLKVQLGEMFLLMAAHDRRHIWASEQIKL
jgi:DinB superfamily